MPSAKSFVLLYLHSLFGVIGRRLPHSSAYCDKTLRDHGGGKRRVVICGFAAKPSGGFTTGGFALSPYVPLLGACQGTTRQRWVSDQHRSGTPMIRLRTSIRSRGHLSHLFLRFIGEPRGFDSWAGSGGATRYKKAINLT